MADWKKLLDSTRDGLEQSVRTAGDALTQAADGARKVAGIGVGSIAIAPEHNRYCLGDTVRGSLTLELSEPTPARHLSVTLRATRKRLALENLGRRGGARRMETEVAFEHIIEVRGEQTFESGQFSFDVDIPTEIDPPVEIGGLLGDALRGAAALKSMTESKLRWKLIATLEIPWKRNVQHEIDVAVRMEQRPPAPPAPPRPEPKSASAASIPTAVPLPTGWIEAMDRCLAQLRTRGWVVIHHHVPPPVSSATVMGVLARHPDLDPEILQFYGVMDGLEIVVGRPLDATAEHKAVQLAAKHDGPLGCLDEIHSMPGFGLALEAEFAAGDGVRILEIASLEGLFSDTELFQFRDDKNVIFGAATLAYGEHFGLTRADEILRWRQPARGATSRDGMYDHAADAYQAALRKRTTTDPSPWWVVRGEDHGACLAEPACVLRWTEMLTAALDHLLRP